MSEGTLYICATPIGNLEDITMRVLRILREADFIAAEDTRQTLKLLNRYEIKNSLVSCHEHNTEKLPAIISRIKSGETCALVTDAGMPCISDPGFRFVQLCAEEGVSVKVCPGASASVAAVALSGFDCSRFVFEGFLPVKKKERKLRLQVLAEEERAIVIYESPKRIGATLTELSEILGAGREAVVIKEMTKIYERAERGMLGSLSDKFADDQKGEFVIVINRRGELCSPDFSDISVINHINLYLSKGLTLKEAMKLTAKDRNVGKSEIYTQYIKSKGETENG